MRIVTSGAAYLDIDAYAGCIAYTELLRVLGNQAKAVSTAPLNESVSQTVRSWHAPLQSSYTSSPNDTYTLIDISDPAFFDKIVERARVDEVIDHHLGFEEYWRVRLRANARIEFIGAACTLVYERWKASGLLEKMSVVSSRLLICGILDNTLNFGAKVTTPRDIEAYNTLLSRADLPDNWTVLYFTECQDAILKDVVAAIQNDTKIVPFKSFNQPVCVGQLAVWDGRQMLAKHQHALQAVLSRIKPHWFMNLISVSERKSYFVTDNAEVGAWLSKLLGVPFDGRVGVADRLWLRKEIIKQDGIVGEQLKPN